MEDQKLILPNVISDAQPIQCPIQHKTEIFLRYNLFFQKKKKEEEDKNWLAKITVP